jgi:hypothetical protein
MFCILFLYIKPPILILLKFTNTRFNLEAAIMYYNTDITINIFRAGEMESYEIRLYICGIVFFENGRY